MIIESYGFFQNISANYLFVILIAGIFVDFSQLGFDVTQSLISILFHALQIFLRSPQILMKGSNIQNESRVYS